MLVRTELLEDRGAIATLIARTYPDKGGEIIEQTSVLRSLASYNSNTALVAEEGGVLKAFALYTPVEVSGHGGAVVLAPLAVDVKDSQFDIVTFLEESFKQLLQVGYRYVFVIAALDDLAPLGFVFADSLGFTLKGDIPLSLLVKDLGEGATLKGEVSLPQVLLD